MMDLALILITAVLGLTVVIALYIYKVSYVYIASWCDGNVAINLDIAIASLALLDRFFLFVFGYAT